MSLRWLKKVFDNFIQILKDNDYSIDYKVVYAPEYGVPQKRKRLLLLASKLGEIKLLPPQFAKDSYPTLGDNWKFTKTKSGRD